MLLNDLISTFFFPASERSQVLRSSCSPVVLNKKLNTNKIGQNWCLKKLSFKK